MDQAVLAPTSTCSICARRAARFPAVASSIEARPKPTPARARPSMWARASSPTDSTATPATPRPDAIHAPRDAFVPRNRRNRIRLKKAMAANSTATTADVTRASAMYTNK